MRLLVGYDGSEGAGDALELAEVFVQGHDERSIERIEVDRESYAGSPATAILERAERDAPDALVLGSPHRGAVGRTLLGSVAEEVLHGAPCAVAVAPRGYAGAGHGPFGLIAVAYDGTPEARAALYRGRALAEASRASLRVLTVVAPPVAMPGGVGYAPAEPADPEEVLAEAVRVVGPSVTVEGRKLDGPPAPTLAQACEDGVDLLITGSRGYGPVMRTLLGSTSSRLIAEAPCPVLVVPRPKPDDE